MGCRLRARLAPLVNRSRPRPQGLGLGIPLHPREHARVGVQQVGDGDAVTTEQALEEREGTVVQRLRLRVPPVSRRRSARLRTDESGSVAERWQNG